MALRKIPLQAYTNTDSLPPACVDVDMENVEAVIPRRVDESSGGTTR